MLVPTRHALTLTFIGVVLAGWATRPAPLPVPSQPTRIAGGLEDAVTGCGLTGGVQLIDAGTSLTIDTKGPGEATGAPVAGVKCVLEALNVPGDIQSRMTLSTSSEQNSASWEGRDLSWSYDPETWFHLALTDS